MYALRDRVRNTFDNAVDAAIHSAVLNTEFDRRTCRVSDFHKCLSDRRSLGICQISRQHFQSLYKRVDQVTDLFAAA